MRWNYLRIAGLVASGLALLFALGFYGIACSYVYLKPTLPTTEQMRHVELQVPLRVYTRSGQLIAQIGEERRIPLTYDQIPDLVKHAFLAAEDDRFFEHHGIDFLGMLRAIMVDIISHHKTQGASTITMQAARNMFLTLDKTYRRKLQEAFVTYKMEHEFTKQEIFGLYLNVIFFGQRAYGVAAASETFFGKPLDQLDVAEAATIAGIPKAPSRFNPIINPEAATARRAYVLRRMRELGYITPEQAEAANREPMNAQTHGLPYDVEAPYVAEMARQEVLQRFGPRAETAGYKVFTTIDGRLQDAANRAVRLGLIEYDRRHGYRGPLGHATVTTLSKPAHLDEIVSEYASVGNLLPAVVISTRPKSARVYVRDRGFATIDWDGLSWARPLESDGSTLGPAPQVARDVVSRGDVVYVVADTSGHAQLAQLPQVQGALVSLDPRDGAIAALVGGFDYFANKFNRATQAERQPGSGFKPFLYSSALENGFTAASVIPDTPFVLDNAGAEQAWRPVDDSHHFGGLVRLREALVHSLNLVSIRLLHRLGTQYAINYAARFGFDPKTLPDSLSLALGTLQITPLQLASAYAVFANGGYRITPYFIDRIEDANGHVIWRASPKIACDTCDQPVTLADLPAQHGSAAAYLQAADAVRGGPGPLPASDLAPRVISPQNDYIMTDMMADVIKHGTGRRALVLNRSDIAGKTGTSNGPKDAWFNGFTPGLVATVWVGYDEDKALGANEQGATAALPIWIQYMREALRGVPEYHRPMPDGLVTLRISPTDGTLVSAENPDGINEIFMANHLPAASQGSVAGGQGPGGTQQSGEPIF